MDWYPSLMEWCGVKLPELSLDGQSLQPIIDSKEAPTAHPIVYFQWQNRWAVREGDWKLLGRNPRDAGGKVKYSLHSLADEEPEKKDYASEKPEKVQRLGELYKAWIADVEN